MILQKKSLEKLRLLINEETEYRKGPALVDFFNEFGFRDVYGQGFPSRWMYTDEKLEKLNGTPELDKVIKKVLSPVNFIGRYADLEKHINSLNEYLAYDGWKVLRTGTNLSFVKSDGVKIDIPVGVQENDFLKHEFADVSLDRLGLDGAITEILANRLLEIKCCLNSKSPLAAIFVTGSTLEGILLGIAIKNPRDFNVALASPKDKEGKVKTFPEWTLSDFINVAYENRYLFEDVKKFSHVLRDFRNYIHPYQQLSTGFNPDMHTSRICWQVLKAAIFQISKR